MDEDGTANAINSSPHALLLPKLKSGILSSSSLSARKKTRGRGFHQKPILTITTTSLPLISTMSPPRVVPVLRDVCYLLLTLFFSYFNFRLGFCNYNLFVCCNNWRVDYFGDGRAQGSIRGWFAKCWRFGHKKQQNLKSFTATLDKGVDLVGAIDGRIQARVIVEDGDKDVERACLLFHAFWGWGGDNVLEFVGGEKVAELGDNQCDGGVGTQDSCCLTENRGNSSPEFIRALRCFYHMFPTVSDLLKTLPFVTPRFSQSLLSAFVCFICALVCWVVPRKC